MIEKTIAEIEARLADADSVSPETRKELLALLSQLKGEIGRFSETHEKEAQQIAGSARASTEAVIASARDPHRTRLGVDALAASVSGFETSHPRLVEIVNRICVILSNIGI